MFLLSHVIPRWGASQYLQTPTLRFISQLMQKSRFFFFLANACVWMSQYIPKITSKLDLRKRPSYCDINFDNISLQQYLQQQPVASTQICCACSFSCTSVSRVTHDCHVQGLAGKSLFKAPKTLAIWNFLGLQIPRIGIVIIIIKTIFILGDKYGCSFVAKISKWLLHTIKMNYRYLGNDFFSTKDFHTP